MKLYDFLLEFPDTQEMETDINEAIANLEVKILVQTTNAPDDITVGVKEVERDWNNNTILIKTEYISL